ncbi:hypothetical protein LXT12_11725 [Pelomonas sp. P7]|uniref:DUF3024 domain-containing protein n=1 Tax=Pelomonas caseinilytica TaxID=2906763 RepID=A0ABS8XAH8_9BURK|nr:hypothetical protein [Pelomonas sp. P7]MCE4537917.1 hypothetical protein [Pelomonas sp. P7]
MAAALPRRPPSTEGRAVRSLAQARIERALSRRARYRYVVPRVEREGRGWKVVSPNCSRNVDRSGGDIAIAWFVPLDGGHWLLHSRDHRAGCWRVEASGLTLEEALQRVCEDPLRVFWP